MQNEYASHHLTRPVHGHVWNAEALCQNKCVTACQAGSAENHCALGLTRLLCRGCIDEGADVNARDLWDSVPLYYACKTGKHALAFWFEPGPAFSKLATASARTFVYLPLLART